MLEAQIASWVKVFIIVLVRQYHKNVADVPQPDVLIGHIQKRTERQVFHFVGMRFGKSVFGAVYQSQHGNPNAIHFKYFVWLDVQAQRIGCKQVGAYIPEVGTVDDRPQTVDVAIELMIADAREVKADFGHVNKYTTEIILQNQKRVLHLHQKVQMDTNNQIKQRIGSVIITLNYISLQSKKA